MNFDSVDSLRKAGFEGFQTLSELWATKLKDVPEAPGVYVVFRGSLEPPSFLRKSRAGLYKGQDPTVSVEELERNWVPDARVLYVGKAGGSGIKQGLHSRLRKYVRGGFAERSARWGGRLIWQLADAPDLRLGWKRVSDREPKAAEDELIADFKSQFGAQPFANLSEAAA